MPRLNGHSSGRKKADNKASHRRGQRNDISNSPPPDKDENGYPPRDPRSKNDPFEPDGEFRAFMSGKMTKRPDEWLHRFD